jgi:hypothetical protein
MSLSSRAPAAQLRFCLFPSFEAGVNPISPAGIPAPVRHELAAAFVSFGRNYFFALFSLATS